MDKSKIRVLAEILQTYYTEADLVELAHAFELYLPPDGITALGFARRVIEELNLGKHGLLLETVLEQTEIRSRKALTDPYAHDYGIHSELRQKVRALREGLAESAIPHEIAVSEAKPFSAKSEIREFLGQAQTEVLIVDNYVGLGTLDCLRDLKFDVRLLTGTRPESVETDFARHLEHFRSEGFPIEVRQHSNLHDRHLVFNRRCWLVGSSLKHAGRKAFYATEIIDTAAQVVAALEAKWGEATAFPPPTPVSDSAGS